MNDTQRGLFEYNNKTTISENRTVRNSTLKFFNKMELRKKHGIIHRKSVYLNNFDEMKKFYDVFSLIKNDKNEDNFEFNRKILRFIDEDLVRIFQGIYDSNVSKEKSDFFAVSLRDIFTLSKKEDFVRILPQVN